ncbi:hypothetical protein BDR04DRAFT_1155842 [Suillus decipiens]|nr:hypothetical protein BDR04DRAFT_1155842 [Suillus decipiens]
MSPAGETGASSTPPRSSVPVHGSSEMESTPNSRGASAVSENIGVLGVKKVRPWIQRDTEQVKECKADAMLQALLQRASSVPETKQPEVLQKCLKAVLPVCNGQTSTALVKSSDVETALNEYIRPGVENNFYSPFIRATNIALACLGEIKIDGMRAPVPAVDMICQQNDMPMCQTHQSKKSTPKSDIVILPLSSARAPFQGEKCSKKGIKKGKQKDRQKDENVDGENDQKDDEQRNKKRKTYMDTNATLASSSRERREGGRKGLGHRPLLTQPASGTASAVLSSVLTTTQPSQGRSSSKRKATDPLESAAKRSKMDPNDTDADADLDVARPDGSARCRNRSAHKEIVAKISWGEASRTSGLEILKKVQEIAKRHATVRDYVPELLWHHTFPTSAIREVLSVPDPTTGSRVLHILVFRKLLPITKLQSKELFDVRHQCILCHLTLWKEGVHHQDVSPGNLMWYWKDGKKIGV